MLASLITFTLALHSLNFFSHHVPNKEDVYFFLLNVSMVSYLSFSVGGQCFSFHPISLWVLTIGMSQNADHEVGALRSVTQTLWSHQRDALPQHGLCWVMQCSQALCKVHLIHLPQKWAEKVRNMVMLVRTVFSRKSLWCPGAFPISDQTSSAQVSLGTGCSVEVPWVILSNQAGYRLLWKQGGHKISTGTLLSCLCTFHSAAEIHPPWFFTCCPGLL